MKKRIVRFPEVLERTGLSKSSIYKRMKEKGDFPQSISLGQRSKGWLESDIDEWIEGRIELSGGDSSSSEGKQHELPQI